MEVNAVNYSANTTATSNATSNASTASSKPAEQAAASAETENTDKAAVYEPSEKTEKKVSPSDIRRMLEETNRQSEALREMILKMINRQAGKDALSVGQKPAFEQDGMIEIDEETRQKAQEDIAEGGYYSVENTGDRILDFAFAIAGDDPEMLEKMREATLKGFEAAEEMWGGKLPQISYDTMEYVKQGFEDKMAAISGK